MLTKAEPRGGFLLRDPVFLAIAATAAAVFAFPLWFMATSAFKAEHEIQAIPIHWLPHDFQWLAQFKLAGEIAPLWLYFTNSMIFSLSHAMATVFFGAMAGFGFAKYRFPGRTMLFLFVISTLMVPFQILVVPLFIVISISAGRTAMRVSSCPVSSTHSACS